MDILYSQNLLISYVEYFLKKDIFVYPAFLTLLFSLVIKFSTRTIILKDHAEWLMGLCIVFYPSVVDFILGYKLMMYKPVSYFLLGSWVLIFIGFIANSFIYNRWNIFKAFISIIAKILITLFSYYLLLKLYDFYIAGYFKGLAGYMKLLGFSALYFILLWLFMNGKKYLDGNYRLCDVYFWLGRIFLWSSIAFSIFVIFSGYGLLTGLSVVLYGVLFFILFKFLFKLSAWSHVKALLRRLGENPFKYKVKIFFADEINAFAYLSTKRAVGVTDKLIKKFSVDELNFALAHEIAHHRNSHLSVKFWTEVFTRGGIRILASVGILTGWLGFLTTGMVQFFKKGLYKKEEYEADEFAVQYLKEAGLTQRGALTFFEKLQKVDSDRGFIRKILNLFLEDHPYPEKRLERIKSFVEF